MKKINKDKIDTAIILAGGRGLRLLSADSQLPKAMVEIINRPILEWIVLWLKKNGIKKILISVDHKKEAIIKHFGNGKRFGMSITYNDHKGAKETGDAFRSAIGNTKLPEVFVALNGDQITDMPLKKLIAHHQKYNPIATITTCPVRNPYGIIEIDNEHRIKSFSEKPILPGMYMNTGIYVFNKKIFSYLPKRGTIERTTFVTLSQKNDLRAFKYDGLYVTVNNRKDQENAEKVLKKLKKKII